MSAEHIRVYLWLYSATSSEPQDEVWGHIIKPQIGRLCPEGWTSDIGYPRQEQDIQTAYVQFTSLEKTVLGTDTWQHLYNLAQLISHGPRLDGVICRPVNPDTDGVQFLRMTRPNSDPRISLCLQRRFCTVLLYSLLGQWNYAVNGMVENWGSSPEGSNFFLRRPDYKVAVDCLPIFPPSTVESKRPTTSGCLKMSPTPEDVDSLERTRRILETRKVEEAWFHDVLLKLIELPDLLLRVSRQFKMALTDLQSAIKSLRVTVDDRGAVTVDDKDLESILEHATNCLEQTSLLYKVSMDENDRRIAKSTIIGGVAVVAGCASWWLGTLAAIGGALACVGAGYLYLNSDYLQKRVRRLVRPLHRIWFLVRLLYMWKNGIVDVDNPLLAAFARGMKEKYEISVQDFMNPTYAETFLSKEIDAVNSVVVEIMDHVRWRESWIGDKLS
ncbi:hypothetical protein KXX00_005569 [Aspergillus fumigatus]|nr:hypothetical protein KXX00_005569 [Aspergillus fumigatus]